ncbi:MAG: alpha/beta hydrolase [Desulfobacterales bacterium]|nr:MAG: alpha/beta hydrolase [Desulfobacterales bacterium]
MQERKTGGIGYIVGSWPLDPDKSTIVFIHGAGGSGYFWQAQIDALADRVNTVAIDLPGHGRSDGSGKDNIEDYANVVDEFINDIDVPGPIVCGISLGGAVAQQLLLDYPGRFPAGILISTGAKLRVASVIFETIEKDFAEFVDMIAKFAGSKKTNPKLLQPFKEDIAKCKPEVVIGDFRACDCFDSMARLSAIEVPVLIITSEDDILTPPKYGEFLREKIKNAHRIHFLDAGHIVPVEKAEEVNAAINEFLEKQRI